MTTDSRVLAKFELEEFTKRLGALDNAEQRYKEYEHHLEAVNFAIETVSDLSSSDELHQKTSDYGMPLGFKVNEAGLALRNYVMSTTTSTVLLIEHNLRDEGDPLFHYSLRLKSSLFGDRTFNNELLQYLNYLRLKDNLALTSAANSKSAAEYIMNDSIENLQSVPLPFDPSRKELRIETDGAITIGSPAHYYLDPKDLEYAVETVMRLDGFGFSITKEYSLDFID